MKKNNYLEKIVENAEKYQSLLLDKAILFIYQNKKDTNYIEVKFKKENFKHLTGVETRLKPAEFFDNCINHRLRIDSYRATSFTPLKLSVFPTLVHLPEIPATIGEFNGANPHLQLDIVIAKYQMVLGLSKEHSKFYFPATLLKEGNFFNYMKSQNPILLTFIKRVDSERTEYISSYVNDKCDKNTIISELSRDIVKDCQLS
jgi:hypothetical protein